MFNSSGLSTFCLNLVGSAFSFLGASYTQRTLFFTLFWIQGSVEAKTTNASCSCIEIKAPWLAVFRLRLGVEGATQGSSGHRPLWSQGMRSRDSG